MIKLTPVTDDHFALFLGELPDSAEIRQPPGGIDSPEMLKTLRRMVSRLHNGGSKGHWLIVDEGEVVGLCGYKRPPDDARSVEIGYGIAPARRKMGYATKAISLLLKEAATDTAVEIVLAETALENPASQIVLERNGFEKIGVREDSEDGTLALWRLALGLRVCDPANLR